MNYDEEFEEAKKKTMDQDGINQQLLHDNNKINLKLTRVREKLEDSTDEFINRCTEVIEKNLPNIRKEIKIQINNTYRTPNNYDDRRSSRKHTLIKLSDSQIASKKNSKTATKPQNLTSS